jgi:hypothetical protein
VSRDYIVREDGEPVEDALTIAADTEYDAAEAFVEALCDGDGEEYETPSRTVIVTAKNGKEVRYTVTIDWSPTFCAVAE